MRKCKKQKHCIDCFALSSTGDPYHEKYECKLNYEIEKSYWGIPVPTEPCPKPFQYRTFIKCEKRK